MRIAFTHNLKTSDDEAQAEFDTADTVRRIADSLREAGHDVHPVDVGVSVGQLVARLESIRPDLVFNTAEGTRGRFREAFYPALFEQLGIPYTGSGPHVCALTLDKQATKMLVARAGVPTPKWRYYDRERPLKGRSDLRFPVIVKPNFEGSSKGVSADGIVHERAKLQAIVDAWVERYPSGVIVEEFIVGRDVTVPYLESVGVLAPALYTLDVEGVDEGYAIYDYTLKNHEWQRVALTVPAPFEPALIETLKRHTTTVMRELDIRDLGRADYRLTAEGELYFIEVNALPSLEEGASLYLSASEAGVKGGAAVMRAVIESAVARQDVKPRQSRGDTLSVGLAYNLRRVDPRGGSDDEAEFDSPQTVDAIAEVLESLGHEVVRLEATPELPKILGDLELDVVFNIAEGLRGRSREAQVPALLDLLGIEFTGSDAATMAITLDKGLAKRLVREAGLPTPAWEVIPPGAKLQRAIRVPAIVKPNAEGSSKGVSASSVVRTESELAPAIQAVHETYGSGALVEEFLPGRELTVGILGEDPPRALPIMEVRFTDEAGDLPIYSYAHKTSDDTTTVSFDVPASLDPALEARAREVALGCFETLGCRDVARIDLRLDAEGEPCFIECNPLPGLSPGWSDLCVIAQAAGLDYPALITAILAPALRRLERSRGER